MAIDYDTLIRMPIPSVAGHYTERDTVLYALSVGMGANPVDERELRFVFERGLRVLPTMATVLVWNDAWMYETGVDMTKQLHGEHRIRIHRPLPAAASVVGETKITGLFDKGPGKGAIMLFDVAIRDAVSG